MAAIEDATLLKVAQALFDEPGVRIAAVADNGLFIDAPATWPDLPRLPGKSLLDSVTTADKPRIIETWERARTERAGSVRVRTLAESDSPEATAHVVDLRFKDGVWLVALVASEGSTAGEQAPERPADASYRPRFARLRKDTLAMILDIDEATTQLLGWSPQEMVGKRSLEFVHPDDHEVAIGSWIELLASPGLGRRVRLRHLCKDGNYTWFELTNKDRKST